MWPWEGYTYQDAVWVELEVWPWVEHTHQDIALVVAKCSLELENNQ